MRLRHLLLIGLLGVAAAMLPAMASSETTQTVNATGGGYGEGYAHAWSPAQVTISAGGVVTFTNHSSEVPHGIIWTSSAKPTCEEGSGKVPVGEEHFGTQWSGSCTFSQAGTYTFECSVHHREMTGTITVNPNGTTTTTMTTAPSPTATAPTPTTTTPSTSPLPHQSTSNARKLAKALKACKKKPRGRRAACVKRARKRYPVRRK